MPDNMSDNWFDEKPLRKLERLSLVANHVRAGAMKGERRYNKRGTSIEFADYRNYTRGDDLRRVDWNVFARLDRPFIKLLEEEEDLAVHLLIDGSGSMDWPIGSDGEHNKFTFSRRVLAGLGNISLGSGDQLTVTSIGKQYASWGPKRGRGHTLGLLEFIGVALGG